MVTSNQVKIKPAGAIFQGRSLWVPFAQPLHRPFWPFLQNSEYSPESAVTTRRSVPLLLQPSKYGSNEPGSLALALKHQPE